jgi:hypothetical protein
MDQDFILCKKNKGNELQFNSCKIKTTIYSYGVTPNSSGECFNTIKGISRHLLLFILKNVTQGKCIGEMCNL